MLSENFLKPYLQNIQVPCCKIELRCIAYPTQKRYHAIQSDIRGEILSGMSCQKMARLLPSGRKICPILLYSDSTQVYRWKTIDVSIHKSNTCISQFKQLECGLTFELIFIKF